MISYSLYKSYTQPLPTRHDAADWSEFVLQMAELVALRPANDKTKKHGTPAVSPALYAEGDTRGNDRVQGWGGWCALDVDNDLAYIGVAEAVAYLTGLNLNFLVYTSTKSKPAHHRFRVVLPLSRWLEPDEAQTVWKAVVQALGSLGADAACKDISRLYGAPSEWVAAEDGNTDPYNAFECRIDGDALDVDAVLSAYVEPEVILPSFVTIPVVSDEPVPDAKPRRRKRLPRGHTLMDSPIVASHYVEEYIGLNKGEHHVGLYKFMTRVIGRASKLNYEVSPSDVLQYCRELDAMTPLRRDAERWKRIDAEIQNAFRFSHNYSK